ncbi:sensor histidine kinase [Paenibacillus sp. GCM10012307]|uniref:histidine kinase n=1 Tax=Paenibacillus roseus TaxID=2798579 RepID=A0A934MLH4_9BACL|nr:HAMP domain-containing sensor histidine kinase [Paenibacillus roseus]MBJ6362200.1 HAMP domain-containing histidine kinase [Paenibacillus roseus]
MSIRLRLTLWYSGLLAITLIGFGVSIFLLVHYFTYSTVKVQIEQQVNSIVISPSKDFWERLRLNVNPNTIKGEELYIQVINYQTNDRTTTMNLAGADFPFPGKANQPEEGYVGAEVNGNSFLVYQRPLILRDSGEMVGLLQVAAYTGREERLLNHLKTILISSSIAALMIAFTFGLFLARKALQPIENVIQATNKIENGSNLSVRIPRGNPNDEMSRLTDTLNGMLERLETTYNELDEAYKAQRRFVSDASHELRTPLTTIRGNIDLLEKMWKPELGGNHREGELVVLHQGKAEMSLEAMRDISDEAKRMSRLVSDLLSLARADAGYVMEKTSVELLPLVEEVARRAQLLPRTVELQIDDLSSLDSVYVQGNADYLRQLLFIFIENAFKYTPEGHVEIKSIVMDKQAGIVVSDTGIGMNSDEIPHIFERFYRADLSRGKTAGTGLGLSIAKWIIDEHNGSIEVKTREGDGTTFIIWLPVAFPGSMDWGIMEPSDRKLV